MKAIFFFIILSSVLATNDDTIACLDDGLHTLESVQYDSDKITCEIPTFKNQKICDITIFRPNSVICTKIGSSINYNSLDHISDTVLNSDWQCLDTIKPWLDGIYLRCGKSTDACRTTKEMCYISYNPTETLSNLMTSLSSFLMIFFFFFILIFLVHGTHCFLLLQTNNPSKLESGTLLPCVQPYKRYKSVI